MHRSSEIGSLCILAYDRGLVGAAVFDCRKGTLLRRRLWTRGARPSWVRSASFDMRTLVVDYGAPTLVIPSANDGDAKEKLTRMGVGNNSLLARTDACTVALRAERVEETASAVLDSGMVCDCVTSLSAVELAQFLAGNATADGGRLSFHPGTAVWSCREAGRVSVRRFALPEASVEMGAALQLYTGALLTVDGLLEIGGPAIVKPDHVTLRDLRIADADAILTGLLERTAQLYKDGRLAVYENSGKRAGNAARRWLPPVNLALGILTLATLAPLYSALGKTHRLEETLSATRELKAEAHSRAEENREILARIEKLSTDYNRIIDGKARTSRTIGILGDIQNARKSARRLRFDTITIDHTGKRLTLSGHQKGSSDELATFVERLTKTHFRLTSDLAVRQEGGEVAFSMNLEATR